MNVGPAPRREPQKFPARRGFCSSPPKICRTGAPPGMAGIPRGARVLPGHARETSSAVCLAFPTDRTLPMHTTKSHAGRRKSIGRKAATAPDPDKAAHLYNEGVTLQQQGKTSLAESAFRRALSLHPEFAEAHNNLGNVLLEQKKWKAAEKSFRRALKLIPDNAMLLSNIGKTLHQQGKTEAALETLRQAIRLDPHSATAMHTLGTVLMETGKADEAVEQFRRAHVLLPESPEVATRLGGALYELERFEEAVDILHDTVKAHPRYFDAYPKLADAAFEIGAVDDAFRVLHEAARLKPEDDSVLARLAGIHLAQGNHLEARSAISRAIRINPGTADHYNLLGRILHKLNILDDAESMLRKAIELEPRNAKHHFRLGGLLHACGKRENAVKSIRQAIKLDPEKVNAWAGLARTCKTLEPGDIRKMQALLQDRELSDQERISLHFGLGTHFDVQGDYETAYAHILKGNALQASGPTHPVDNLAKAMDLSAVLTTELIKKHEQSGYRDSTPIFITGLSRSGKTVLETLLARHSLVTAGGESMDLFNAIEQVLTSKAMESFPECVRDLPGSVFTEIGREYTAREQQRYPDITRVTNTSPGNAWYIGLLRLCLPNAKVIVCQRDARDNCTGIFNKNLGPDHHYSFDLHTLGAYYRRHRDLIEHWRNLLPDFIHVVQFEELVRDPQTQINAVLDFCGLPGEEACLETASLPDPDAVIGIWEHYREPLRPLFEILEK